MENDKNLKLAEKLINPGYVEIGQEALNSFSGKIRCILAQRRLPDQGLEDREIEHLILQLSAMDTNNFEGKIGVGEREGRIYSQLVLETNFPFISHILYLRKVFPYLDYYSALYRMRGCLRGTTYAQAFMGMSRSWNAGAGLFLPPAG